MVRLTDRPDMTLDVYRECKTRTTTQHNEGSQVHNICLCYTFLSGTLYDFEFIFSVLTMASLESTPRVDFSSF